MLWTRCRYGQSAGIRFTAQGITLNDDGINTLKLALAQRPQNTAECKTFIGSVLYGHIAFEWRPAEMSWFARMMQPMHAAASATIDIRDKGGAFKWTEECEKNRLELATRVRPRAEPA